MKNKIVCLLFFLTLFSSFSFAQKTQTEINPVTLEVSVDNPLFSPIAPISDGIEFKPDIKNASKIKLWFLTIRNTLTGKKTREIISKTMLPEKVVWDGLDSAGNAAPDGRYSYKFFVLTSKGACVVENSDALIIDSIPPFVSLRCSRDVCFLDEETPGFNSELVIYLSAGDENGIDFSKSYLEILSYNDKRVKEFLFNGKIPEFVTWNGIDDVYSLPVPSGNYKVQFVIFDKAGNSSKIETEIMTAPMPKNPEPEPEKEVKVHQEERGLVINLSSKVLFDVAKSDIKPEAENSLNEVAEILRVYSRNKVVIEGHTDSSGNKEKNMELSIERAQSVFDYLVKRGIDSDRMRYFGYGDDKPVASNQTKEGKEQNRRVEIVILKTTEYEDGEPDNATSEEKEEESGLEDSAQTSSLEMPETQNGAESGPTERE